jgi:hypothetical protein
MREESHTTMRLYEFQIVARGANHVEIDAGREDVGLAVVHDAGHHERCLGLDFAAAFLRTLGRPRMCR